MGNVIESVGELFTGSGRRRAEREARAKADSSQAQNLAQLAAKNAEIDQQGAASPRKRGSRLLDFAETLG